MSLGAPNDGDPEAPACDRGSDGASGTQRAWGRCQNIQAAYQKKVRRLVYMHANPRILTLSRSWFGFSELRS